MEAMGCCGTDASEQKEASQISWLAFPPTASFFFSSFTGCRLVLSAAGTESSTPPLALVWVVAWVCFLPFTSSVIFTASFFSKRDKEGRETGGMVGKTIGRSN